jgi:hypothetical protein
MILELAIYDEIADFLATAAPAEILAFRPSELTQKRFEELVEKKKEGLIVSKEQEELDHFLMLEHIFRLAKARAAAQIEA